MAGMKTTDHLLGDRVSVRLRNFSYPLPPGRPGALEVSWTGGRIIARDPRAKGDLTRYVVQLDDNRRVVAFDDDVRRWTLSFDMAS